MIELSDGEVEVLIEHWEMTAKYLDENELPDQAKICRDRIAEITNHFYPPKPRCPVK